MDLVFFFCFNCLAGTSTSWYWVWIQHVIQQFNFPNIRIFVFHIHFANKVCMPGMGKALHWTDFAISYPTPLFIQKPQYCTNILRTIVFLDGSCYFFSKAEQCTITVSKDMISTTIPEGLPVRSVSSGHKNNPLADSFSLSHSLASAQTWSTILPSRRFKGC